MKTLICLLLFLCTTIHIFPIENHFSLDQHISNKINKIDSIENQNSKEIGNLKLKFITIDNIDNYFKDKFVDADGVLKHRESTIDWWLTGIAIGISILTVLFSLVIFFIGRSFYNEIKHEKENLKKDLEFFKKDYRSLKSTTIREAHEMKIEATRIIEELKSYRTSAQTLTVQIETLLKMSNKKDDELNNESKNKAIQIAKSIEENIYASDFQKLLASAFDCYYSDNFNEAINKYLLLLKDHSIELTVAQLCKVYYRIGYSYLSVDDYINSIKYLMNLLTINPNDYDALVNIGIAYKLLGEKDDTDNNIEKAFEYYSKAIDLNSCESNDWLYSNIANLFMYKCDYKTAIDWYDKALRINKNDEYLSSKIECLIFNNDLELAEKELNNKKNTEESFDIVYLSSLIEIIKGTEQSAINVYRKLRQQTGTRIETTDWDFIELNQWLNSNYSNFLSSDSKNVLIELNKLINQWEEESLNKTK